MEENVALDSSKQHQFVKSIKGIKNLLKDKRTTKSIKIVNKGVKAGKVKKSKRKPRGLVYLSHIPHGFYEHQMTEYFKQFGVVTNARVIRSKRTGMSKGHAFVEFKDTKVAQIVAETMNNYLMGKRLIKAAVIPPEKQKRLAKRKHWNAQKNPGNDLRQKMKKAHNSIKTEDQELKIAKRLLSNLHNTKKKLQELGIDYDFFTPVDVPESLLTQLDYKKVNDTSNVEIKDEKKPKLKVQTEEIVVATTKKDKVKKSVNKVEDKNVKPTKQAEVNKKSKQVTESQKAAPNKESSKKETQKPSTNKSSKVDTKVTKEVEKKVEPKKEVVKQVKEKQPSKGKAKLNDVKINKMQDEKEKKLKAAGVKPPNFIKIQQESDDGSDNSMDFDSDEFEKMMEDDSDLQSDIDSDETEVIDEEGEELDSPEEKSPKPQKKIKRPLMQTFQAQQKNQKRNKGKKGNVGKPLPQPRIQKDSSASKKPTFEKKGKKTLNKVIKKKK